MFNRIIVAGLAWTAVWTSPSRATDDDGDKNLYDVAEFQICFGRSGAELEPDCTRADWDRDGVIRGREIAELSRRLRGPGSEAN